MTARAAHKTDPSPQLFPTPKTKIVDAPKPVKENGEFAISGIAGREIVGGVSVAADAPQWVKDSLARKGRLAKESAERKARRLAPAKNPWTPERKLAAGIARAAREHADLQEARAICEAWWKRPKPPHWREREKWTPGQHREFAERIAEFDATHREPTKRQLELVGEDNERFVDGMPGITEKPTYTPGTEPWVRAKSYRVMRAKYGFKAEAGRAAGGNGKYTIPAAFEEAYLRSTLSYVLWRFVTSTPKGGKRRKLLDGTVMQPLMGGPMKSDRREYWAKLEALDQPYIALCAIMRSGFRIEIDRDFASFAELRAHIECKIRKGKLACLPHVVVGHVDAATGVLRHPHLWFWLPEDCKVLYDPANRKASRKAMDLYDGVVNGVFHELEDLGADAGGLGNPIDGKNPLSPEWSAQVWNDTRFPSLHQWATYVNVFLRREHLVREQCIRSSDLPAELSNGVFTDSSKMAWALLHAAHKSGDKQFRALVEDRRELAAWLLERLRPAFALTAEPRKTDKTLRNIARYVAAKWAPGRLERRPNRGIAFPWVRRHELRGEDGRLVPIAVHSRKSIGAKVGNAGKKRRTIDAMVTAMEELWELDLAFTPQAVADRVDVSRRTVDRNWDLALAAYNAGEIQDIGLLIVGDDVIRKCSDHYPTSAPASVDQTQHQPGPYVVHLWPGGYKLATAETSHTATQETETTKPVKEATLDPCCPSTEGVRHEPNLQPSKPNSRPPAPSSTDREAGQCLSVDQAGDGKGIQRTIPEEAGGGWSAGSPDAGRSGPSGSTRRSHDTDAGRSEAFPTLRCGDTAVARVVRRLVRLQQQWNPDEDRTRGRGDVTTPAMTYANRRDPPVLTLAGPRQILFAPVVSREVSTGKPASAVCDGSTRPPWLKRRTA